MKSFVQHLKETNTTETVPPLLAAPDPSETVHTVTTSRRKILSDLGMGQKYVDALQKRRQQYPETGSQFYLPSVAAKDLDRPLTIKYGPHGSYPDDPQERKEAGGWTVHDTVRIARPEWDPNRNFLAHETTHAMQDPSLFTNPNTPRAPVTLPSDTPANAQRRGYLFNKAEPAARANEYKSRYAEITGTPLSPNASPADIRKFIDVIQKNKSGDYDTDIPTDMEFYTTPQGAELLRQAKNEKKSVSNTRLAENTVNNTMKSFLQYISEDTDPYDWDTGYGKRFKWVRTPPGAQTPPQTQPTISLVTPANKDAWDWPEVDTEQLAKLKQNWGEIQQSIAPHKRIQIETGQNMGVDDLVHRVDTISRPEYTPQEFWSTPDWTESGKFGPGEKIPKGWVQRKGLFAAPDVQGAAGYAMPRDAAWATVHDPKTGKITEFVTSTTDAARLTGHTPELTTFKRSDFTQAPTGEWVAEKPVTPVTRTPIQDPMKFLQSQYPKVTVVDDLAGELRTRHGAGAEIRGENLPEFKPRPVAGAGVAMRGLNPLGMLGVVVDTFASPANVDAVRKDLPPLEMYSSKGAKDARAVLTSPSVLKAVQADEKRNQDRWNADVEERHKKTLREARESLERRWRDVNYTMGQVPTTDNPLKMFNQYDVNVNLGGNFPVKIKPFALSSVAGPAGDWMHDVQTRSGEIRLDPNNSTRISPVLWHELFHGTQSKAIDDALFGSKPSSKYVNPKDAMRAADQRAVPYLIRNKEMDARAGEYGKIASNEGRRRLEALYQSTLANAKEIGRGGKIQPTSYELDWSKQFKDALVKHAASVEKTNIKQGLATPTDTPVETAFGGTRAPSDTEVKIRDARARKGEQLVRRGMQNAADMTALGYEDTSSPAMIKGVMRQIKKRTGVKQFTPAEWAPMVDAARAALNKPQTEPMARAAALKPSTVMGTPEPQLPKPTDINTRSMSVSPKFTGRRGAVSADTLATLGGVGGAVVGGMAAGAGAALDSMAGVLSTPPAKDRMYSEKMFNSDVGLGFDIGPDGELEANPAGFKAVRERQKTGMRFPSYFPDQLYK